jgi:hypothetical protein
VIGDLGVMALARADPCVAVEGWFVTYKLTIDQKPAYLHATVTGHNSSENVVRYMEELIRKRTARRCFRVLIEERLDGPRLGMIEVFGMVSRGDVMRFAEGVAVNRGFPVKIFQTVAAAEEWLLQEHPQ